MTAPDWIAVDWGTSNLRVWSMTEAGVVLRRRTSEHGMSTLQPDLFEPTLLSLVEDALTKPSMPVLICGMAGARGGWCEAGYSPVPAAPGPGPRQSDATRVVTQDSRLDVTILPGLSQASPPDVMRGEETQIAGVLARYPGFDGVICLPGTHSKWVRVKDGAVRRFRTYLTGELYGLLTHHSILRLGLDDAWDSAVFAEAVADGLTHPADLSAALFGLRAHGLLDTPRAGETRARVSGMLIGLELAGARPFWEDQPVIIVGDAQTQALYAALTDLAPEVRTADAEEMTLAGLTAARRKLAGGDR